MDVSVAMDTHSNTTTMDARLGDKNKKLAETLKTSQTRKLTVSLELLNFCGNVP